MGWETMNELATSQSVKQLLDRALRGGGFSTQKGGDYGPDATAWAIIALSILGGDMELIEAARYRLTASQLEDGRVGISPDHPESFWPTPLAVLAWQGAPAYKETQNRAVTFLLTTSGLQFKKKPELPFGHDPEIKGWPWRSDTFSWSEPTAMAMMALQVAGYGDHPRSVEAQRLLMDRQIPGGGWNYGNTTVFGQVLHPMPESTGMALNALSQRISRDSVQKTLSYLEDSITRLKTPWSLGWALLGLGSWGARPASAADKIAACLARQERVGSYDTSSLALLLVASKGTGGLVSIYQE